MKILNYKGYQGSIEYEDGQLVIQLLHIDDFITAVCDSAAQAEVAFHELVDDYLATCKETGRAPNKPYKGSLNIRLQPELHRRAAMAAADAGISLNAWMARACEAAMSPSQSVEVSSEFRSAKPAGGEASELSVTNNRVALPGSHPAASRNEKIVRFEKAVAEKQAAKLRTNGRRDEFRSPPGEYDGQTRTG